MGSGGSSVVPTVQAKELLRSSELTHGMACGQRPTFALRLDACALPGESSQQLAEQEKPALQNGAKAQTPTSALAAFLATTGPSASSAAAGALTAEALRTPQAVNGGLFYAISHFTSIAPGVGTTETTIVRRDMSSGQERHVATFSDAAAPGRISQRLAIAGDGSAIILAEISAVGGHPVTTLTLINPTAGTRKTLLKQVPFALNTVISPPHTDLFYYTLPALNSLAQTLLAVHTSGPQAGVSQPVLTGVFNNIRASSSGHFLLLDGTFSADLAETILLLDTRTGQTQPISLPRQSNLRIEGIAWAGPTDDFLVEATLLHRPPNIPGAQVTDTSLVVSYDSSGRLLQTTRLRNDPPVPRDSSDGSTFFILAHSFALTGDAHLVDEGIIVTIHRTKKSVSQQAGLFRLLSYDLRGGGAPQDLVPALSSGLGFAARTTAFLAFDRLLSLPNGVLAKVYLPLPGAPSGSGSPGSPFRARRVGAFVSTTSATSRRLFDEPTAVLIAASDISGLTVFEVEHETTPLSADDRTWISTRPDAPIRISGHDLIISAVSPAGERFGVAFSPDETRFAYLAFPTPNRSGASGSSSPLSLKLYQSSSNTTTTLSSLSFTPPEEVALLAWQG